MSDAPARGEVWRHHKGKDYRVLTLARMEADQKVVVVYEAVRGGEGIPWVRPVAEFMERFTKL